MPLLENGANAIAAEQVMVHGIYGGNTSRTLLHWAAMKGLEKVVVLLLEKGAVVNTVVRVESNPNVWHGLKNEEKTRTVLHWAVDIGYEPAVRLLLEKELIQCRGGRSEVLFQAPIYRGNDNTKEYAIFGS